MHVRVHVVSRYIPLMIQCDVAVEMSRGRAPTSNENSARTHSSAI